MRGRQANPASHDHDALPERFLLLPEAGNGLRVMLAAQCVGYVWSDHARPVGEGERWLACGREGSPLETGPGCTLYEAVAAVFGSCSA